MNEPFDRDLAHCAQCERLGTVNCSIHGERSDWGRGEPLSWWGIVLCVLIAASCALVVVMLAWDTFT